MLFLAFPYVLPLRSTARKLRLFARWQEEGRLGEFHQFALRHDRVVQNLSDDFDLLHEEPRLALTGLEGIPDGLTNALDRRAKENGAWRKVRSALERVATPFTARGILHCLRRR